MSRLRLLAASLPEFQRARKRGRRAAAIRFCKAGSLSAPAAVFYAGRGRDTHTRTGRRSHPSALSPGSRRSRDHRAAALCQPGIRVGSPLATGCRAFHCWRCTASSHLPRPSEGASLATALRTGNAASSRAPALPRVGRSADASQTGRVAVIIGAVRSAGISFGPHAARRPLHLSQGERSGRDAKHRGPGEGKVWSEPREPANMSSSGLSRGSRVQRLATAPFR